MSDQGLRDALEDALATVEQGIARSTKPEREGFLMTSHIRQMLAAHPAEPAPSDYSQQEIAAKIADRVPHADLDGFTLSERLRIGKAVAPLFAELLGLRPLLNGAGS